MADTKVSALSAVASAALTDEFPVNQSGTSKKETNSQVMALLQTLGMPRVSVVSGSDHTNATTTGTEVTTLQQTLEAGTYTFKYTLMCATSLAATGIKLGVNFTGTATAHAFMMYYPGSGTTANTGLADDVGAIGGQLMEANAQTAYSTTAPNLAHTGFTTTGLVPFIVEGVLIVTVAGDLELWHSSEDANSTSIKIGSSLVVVRTA